MEKKLTIEDLLKSLEVPSTEEDKYSPGEIWNMIVNRDDFETMGFDSQKELDKWIEQNPYSDL